MYCIHVRCQVHYRVQFFAAESSFSEGIRFVDLLAEVLDILSFAHYPSSVAGVTCSVRRAPYYHCVVVAEAIRFSQVFA